MDFLWPLVLLGLPAVPAIAVLYVVAERRRSRYAVRFSNLALLREVATGIPGWRRHVPPALYLLALTAMIIAVARPQFVIPVPVRQTTIMLAIDVSRSMEATDVQPNRLAAAQAAAREFVQALPSTVKVGVVSFSGVARLVAPPSADHRIALAALDRLQPENATAIGDGIYVSLGLQPPQSSFAFGQMLGSEGQGGGGQSQASQAERPADPPNAIVLLSDGVANRGVPPLDAAMQAKDMGVKVYTVGLGTTEGSVLNLGGARVRVQLDETTLRRIAELTGGKYFQASSAGELSQIYRELGSQIGWEYQKTEVTALVTGLAAILTLIGAALSVLWFNRFP